MMSAVKDRSRGQRPVPHHSGRLTASRLFSDDEDDDNEQPAIVTASKGGAGASKALLASMAEENDGPASDAASPLRGGRLFGSITNITKIVGDDWRMSQDHHDRDDDDDDESVATANASDADCSDDMMLASPTSPPSSSRRRRQGQHGDRVIPPSSSQHRPAAPANQMFNSRKRRSGSDLEGRSGSPNDEDENDFIANDRSPQKFGTTTTADGGNDTPSSSFRNNPFVCPLPISQESKQQQHESNQWQQHPLHPAPVQRVRSTDSHDTTLSTTSNSSSNEGPSPVPRTTLPFLSSTGFAPAAGQYSFTASPIDETEEDIDRLFTGVGNKVRRLNLGPDDASSATTMLYGKGGQSLSSGGSGGGGREGKKGKVGRREGYQKSRGEHTMGGLADLDVGAPSKMGRIHEEEDTDQDIDRISPTDVMALFPSYDSPPGTPKGDGGGRSSLGGSAGGGQSEAVAPGTPKISRSARSSRNTNSGGGGCSDNAAAPTTPGTPDNTLDRICSTARSHTPYRAGADRPPGTPVLERRTARKAKTPKIFTFADDTVDNGRHRRGVDSDDEENGGGGSAKGRFETDFQIVGKPLGKGSFGSVHKCLSRLDGCMYAIKVANRRTRGVADRHRMLKEVHALAALSDLADTAAFHIVRYHQAWMEEKRLYIQTELCTSTLQMEISTGRPMPLQRRYKVLREMLIALKLIHKNGMVHLDIKPENIFIKNDQYKLGDFGLVSKITTDSEVEEGDSRYMSMELLSGDHVDLTKSDIFSLGATLYEACLGRSLPANGQEWQDIRAGILLPMPQTPQELQQIVRGMMNPDPRQRADATNLLKKRELLSDEQKQLQLEKNKVLEANMALAVQQERLKKIQPPVRGPGNLVRHNTWNGAF